MKIEDRLVVRQLFICCNSREVRASCGPLGADEIFTELARRLKANDLWNRYKVTKTGCLGPCARGMNAVLMPDNKIITDISSEDVEKLYQLLVNSN